MSPEGMLWSYTLTILLESSNGGTPRWGPKDVCHLNLQDNSQPESLLTGIWQCAAVSSISGYEYT